MDNRLIQNIVGQLRDIQDRETWLDENFKKKIGEISDEQAFERPIPEVHSVAELISHIMEWRINSIRKLNGLKSELTVDSPQNWRTNDELRKTGWEKLQTDFYASQDELIELIKDKPDDYLNNQSADGFSFKYLIEGLIHHDLYHLGQIGITVKLLKATAN